MALTLPPLPSPQAAFVDRGTGLINRSWYEYFKRLDARVREVDEQLAELDARVTALETP